MNINLNDLDQLCHCHHGVGETDDEGDSQLLLLVLLGLSDRLQHENVVVSDFIFEI